MNKSENIHLVGIGGTGMSGIAKFLLEKNYLHIFQNTINGFLLGMGVLISTHLVEKNKASFRLSSFF